MRHHIFSPILAVRFRQRIQRTLDYAAWGLLVAAFCVLFFPKLAAAIFCASVLLSLSRAGDDVAVPARLIDQHYHLKDRVLTATALLHRKKRTPMEQLQIEDTAEHIAVVRSQAIVPIRLPKILWLAPPVLVLELLVFHSNSFLSEEIVEPARQLFPVENVTFLEEIARDTEELVQNYTNEPALQKLSEQLETLLEQFDLTGMNLKESLATLSEMEEAFQSAVDALQLETMEESMQELAKTLELTEKTLPIGKNLKQGDYSAAASELKKLDAEMLESLSEPERKALAEQMQSLAENAEQRGQKPLQEAAQEMFDALENNDGEQYSRATDELASEVEKHGIRKEIGKNLARQQLALAMMKAESGPGNMSGGKNTDKSEQASQTWGSGSAGTPNAGQETDLQGQRQQETLTGMLSEQGDSITETLDSNEMSAARSLLQYQEQYQRYQKLSEAVLDSEPIPLGQRQVIRRYFESIRPDVE